MKARRRGIKHDVAGLREVEEQEDKGEEGYIMAVCVTFKRVVGRCKRGVRRKDKEEEEKKRQTTERTRKTSITVGAATKATNTMKKEKKHQ